MFYSEWANVLQHGAAGNPGIRFRIIDEQERMRAHVRFFVNGKQVFDLRQPLRDNDEVTIVQALSGG
jgi:molybdopterin converting factor small subunit